ncbi:MAG TPA: cache domain-containing protein [Steroidobacteraceae bacterium]|nr:cache domain-containing protein [Steroidobacteraceae bacterium]
MNTRTLLSACVVLGGLSGAVSSALAQGSPPDSAKAKEIAALVEKAAALINAKGKAALPEFRKSGSEWRSGDTYLFGNHMNGMQFLNAGFPEREGTDGGKTKDANGKVIFQEFIRVVQSDKGAGWASYMWPKPGQTQPSQKWSYVKTVHLDGAPAIIGAGFYPQ